MVATAGLPGYELCAPVVSVEFTGTDYDIQLDEACIGDPGDALPEPIYFTVPVDLGPLSAGTHRVRFLGTGGRVLASKTVRVRPAGACVPSSTTLCLQGGRFAVRAMWGTATEQGPARGVQDTPDSGSFTFFDADNVELVVKVLDACNTSFASYWVFATGLTNLRVNLEVEDTLNGVTWSYFNERGLDFQPVLATRALPTCP